MSSTTSPLGLIKPVTGDAVTALRTSISSNADTLNTALGNLLAGLQEGVIDAGSYEVTQASGGASTTVDVASNVGTGAYVQNDSGTGQSLYYVAPTVSKTSVTITAAHASLPRVDAVVVSLTGVVSIVAGTATAGATLDNARDGSHGGAGVPSNALHLADLLVPATDTTISNNQIRDRRKWARGAYYQTTSGGLYAAPGSVALIDGTSLQPRIECSGAPLRVTLQGGSMSFAGTGDGSVLYEMYVDGTLASGTAIVEISARSAVRSLVHVQWDFTPSAGSHLIGPAWVVNTGSGTFALNNTNSVGVALTIQEVPRQNSKNNPTTTG